MDWIGLDWIAYADDVDLVLEFGDILADAVLIGQLALDVGDPHQEAGHPVMTHLVLLFHCLLQKTSIVWQQQAVN